MHETRPVTVSFSYLESAPNTGLGKSAIPLSRTSRFSLWAKYSVCLHSHLPDGQGIRKVVCTRSLKYQTKTCARRQCLRNTCPKGKLEFKYFSSPVNIYMTVYIY